MNNLPSIEELRKITQEKQDSLFLELVQQANKAIVCSAQNGRNRAHINFIAENDISFETEIIQYLKSKNLKIQEIYSWAVVVSWKESKEIEHESIWQRFLNWIWNRL